jgi:hypothetical protein
MADENKFRALFDGIYLSDTGNSGSFGSALRLYEAAKKVNRGVTKQMVVDYLKTIPGYSRHQRVLRKFQRRSFLTVYAHEFYQIDIVYAEAMSRISRRSVKNKNSYILTVIDLFSHRGYAEAMTRKTPEATLQAFKAILERSKHKPRLLMKDEVRGQ